LDKHKDILNDGLSTAVSLFFLFSLETIRNFYLLDFLL